MNDKFINQRVTVREFIDICRNAYGGEVIRKLEEAYTKTTPAESPQGKII